MTLSHSPRVLTTLAMVICVSIAALVGAQESAAASRSCPAPPAKAGLKGGYFSKLRVTNLSCRSGKRLVYAYYNCRQSKGGRRASCAGRTINGLRCSEYRDPDLDIPSEFNARVTCRRGSKKVVHYYQQNL